MSKLHNTLENIVFSMIEYNQEVQLLTALSQPNIDKVYFDNSKLNITFIDKDKECQNNNMI